MVEQSGSERVSTRLGVYIEELREFFTSRGVPFGSPDDVASFARHVASSPAFADELGSMLRSIQFREEDLGRGEMLELVSVAVGGPGMEQAAQDMHASVRQIFLCVNQLLRQPSRDAGSAESTVTASQILAAPEPHSAPEARTMARQVSESDKYRAEVAGQAFAGAPLSAPAVPESNGILFRAVSMAEDESAFPSYGKGGDVRLTRRPWFLPAALAVVAAVGAAVYLGRPSAHHAVPVPPAAGDTSFAAQPVSASSCVAPATAGASRPGLENRLRWAHGLMDQKMYEAALPELRQVAQMDPSYPGINLDQSNALLQMKRPEDARDAVDTQINISDCLARLPGGALDAYCSAEFTPSTVGGCRAQLAHIRQAAELQAALVHLELGHRVAPDAAAPEAALTDSGRPEAPLTAAPAAVARTAPSEPRATHVHRPLPLPPATEADNGQVVAPGHTVAPHAAPTKAAPAVKGDDALRRGEGTDSSFGAYSKPQD